MILAGDVGATKILLEVGETRSGRWEPKLARRYATEDAETFPAVLTDFLGEWNRVRGKADRIDAAGFGVAGPVEGNKAKMTRRPLVVDGTAIESRFLIPSVRVANDLAAAAHGVVGLGSRDLVTIQEGACDASCPRVVMGVGTGLGIAYILPEADGMRVVESEGGHVGYSPASVAELEVWKKVFEKHGRVEAEDVVSGTGLEHIEELLSEDPHAKHAPGDAAIDLFLQCMGNVAGDHALAVLARGGLFLTGGVIARVHTHIANSRFLEAFCGKGAFSATMMKIPVHAVTNERVVLLGAAKLVTNS